MKQFKTLEKRLGELDSIVGIQCSDGNWNTSEYMLGMANGLLLAQATMKDEEPAYKKRPDKYPATKGTAPTAA